MGTGKKIINPKFAGIASFLAAGGVLLTVTGVMREGTLVKTYEPSEPKNNYTILVYMVGSDLESDYGAAADDLSEMQAALEEKNIGQDRARIIVEAGGANHWQYEPMENEEYARFCLTMDGITDFTGMDTRNMGRSDTLADFLNYGIETYPAEHYGLVLWNHGAGQIAGFGSDDNYDGDSLSLLEMQEAFELSDMQKPFEFVTFDACLMGNIELVETMAGYTRYLIASEELEPQNGHDYAWLEIMGEGNAESELSGQKIGERVLQTYADSYKDDAYRVTLSLIDTSAFTAFKSAFAEMIQEVNVSDTLYQRLGERRTAIQGFGSRSDYDIADMVDLMELASVIGNEETIKQVQDAYDKLVVEKIWQGYEKEPGGLSIYLPSGSNEYMVTDMSIYETVPFDKDYLTFARQYQTFLQQESSMEWRQPSVSENSIVVEIDEASLDNLVGAYLVTFLSMESEGNIYLISSDSDVKIGSNGYLKAEPETEYWGMQGQLLCMQEISNTQQITEYVVPILYNGEQCNMIITFSEEAADGIISSILPLENKKQMYQIQEGDKIIPLYPLEQTDEVLEAEIPQEKVYENSYYCGEEIQINSIEAGDAELEQITVKQEECLYGFMIQDNKQKIYYTEMIETDSKK